MKLILDYNVWKEFAYLFEKIGNETKDGGLVLDLSAHVTDIEIHGEGVNKISVGAVINKDIVECKQ